MSKQYKTGTIYKLYTQIDDGIYIGSTVFTMTDRMRRHKQKPPSKKVGEWFTDVQFCNIKYEIISTFDDITEIELRKKEDVEIQKYLKKDDNCLNQKRAYVGIERKEYNKQYREDNKEKIAEQKHKDYEKNKDAIVKRIKKYHEINKDTIVEWRKKNYEANKEAIKRRVQQYRENNKDAIAERKKKNYEANKEVIIERAQKHYEENGGQLIDCEICGKSSTLLNIARHQCSRNCLKARRIYEFILS